MRSARNGAREFRTPARVLPALLTLSLLAGSSATALQAADRADPPYPGSLGVPASIAFFLDICDSGPQDTVISLVNTGLVPVTVFALDVSPDSSFRIVATPPLPFTIGYKDSVTVQLRFAPTSPGDKYATLSISSDAGNGSVQTVDISGRKEAAILRALSLYYGALTPAQLPRTRPIVVSNVGTVPITVDAAVFGNTPPFRIVGGVPATLPPNGIDSIQVEFDDPGADGYFSDSLTIVHSPTCTSLRLLVAGSRLSVPNISGPSTVDFAPHRCALYAKDTAIAFTNTGLVNLVIGTVTITGDPDFRLLSTVPKIVGPGRTDTLTVRFDPHSQGFKTAQMVVESNASDQPRLEITLTGIADLLDVTAPPAGFGIAAPPDFPVSFTLDIENTTYSTVRFDSASLGYPAPFHVVGGLPATVDPGGSVHIDLRFDDPGTDGLYIDSLRIAHTPTCRPLIVPVTGTRTSFPRIATPDEIDFGFRVCGGPSFDTTLTIRNTGGGTLFVSDLTISPGSDYSFAFPPALPKSIPNGGSDTVSLRFTPGGTGIRGAVLTITSTAANLPTRTVILTGEKQSVVLVADTLDFGTLAPPDFPRVAQATIRNTGSLDVTVTALPLAPAAPFTVIGPLPIVVPAGQSRQVDVRFDDPSIDGSYSAAALAGHSPTCGDIAFVVRGSRSGPPGIAAVAMVEFAALVCPGSAEDTVITIRNTGFRPLSVNDASVAGDPEFTVVGPAFPFTIAPGDSMLLSLRFASGAPGPRSAKLTIVSDADNAPKWIVSLTGSVERYSFSADSLDFGARTQFGFPAMRTLTVRNDGTVPVHILQANFARGFYRLLAPLPFIVGPGDSLKFDVEFVDPGSDGSYDDELSLVTDPACGPILSPVTGSRASASAVLRAGTVRGAPGDTVRIPIYLDDPRSLAVAKVTGFAATVRVDRSLLVPAFTGHTTTQGTTRSVDVSLPASVGSGGVLAVLPFVCGLGTDTVSEIGIDNAIALGGAVALTTVPGQFTLDGVCREGGFRLVNASGSLALRQNRPNPFNPVTEIEFSLIEAGHTALVVFDDGGRIVATCADGYFTPGTYVVPFDGSRLASGVYRCVLVTPTQIRSRTMILAK